MIIKFDHLSYSCSFKEEEDIVKRFCGTGCYTVQFKESIKNIPVKMQLMQNVNDTHGLTMLQPVGGNSSQVYLPVEITSYSKVSGCSAYSLIDGIIEFKTVNLKESILFYQQLGFQKESSGMLSLKTMLDRHNIYIRLSECDESYSNCLDVTGFSSIAWIINKMEKYVKTLHEKGIKVTDIDTLTVHGRKLKICFVLGRQGEIIELIGVD